MEGAMTAARHVVAFRNGDVKCQNGVSITVPDALSEFFVQAKRGLGLRTAAERVYSLQGRLLGSPEEVQAEGSVVVTGGESFIPRRGPIATHRDPGHGPAFSVPPTPITPSTLAPGPSPLASSAFTPARHGPASPLPHGPPAPPQHSTPAPTATPSGLLASEEYVSVVFSAAFHSSVARAAAHAASPPSPGEGLGGEVPDPSLPHTSTPAAIGDSGGHQLIHPQPPSAFTTVPQHASPLPGHHTDFSQLTDDELLSHDCLDADAPGLVFLFGIPTPSTGPSSSDPATPTLPALPLALPHSVAAPSPRPIPSHRLTGAAAPATAAPRAPHGLPGEPAPLPPLTALALPHRAPSPSRGWPTRPSTATSELEAGSGSGGSVGAPARSVSPHLSRRPSWTTPRPPPGVRPHTTAVEVEVPGMGTPRQLPPSGAFSTVAPEGGTPAVFAAHPGGPWPPPSAPAPTPSRQTLPSPRRGKPPSPPPSPLLPQRFSALNASQGVAAIWEDLADPPALPPSPSPPKAPPSLGAGRDPLRRAGSPPADRQQRKAWAAERADPLAPPLAMHGPPVSINRHRSASMEPRVPLTDPQRTREISLEGPTHRERSSSLDGPLPAPRGQESLDRQHVEWEERGRRFLEHSRQVQRKQEELLRQQEAFWQRQKRQSEERQALRRQQRLREVRAEVAPAAPLARAPPPPRGPSPSRESRLADSSLDSGHASPSSPHCNTGPEPPPAPSPSPDSDHRPSPSPPPLAVLPPQTSDLGRGARPGQPARRSPGVELRPIAAPAAPDRRSPSPPAPPPRPAPAVGAGVAGEPAGVPAEFPAAVNTECGPLPALPAVTPTVPAPPLFSDSSDPASFLLSSPDGTDIKSWSGVSQPIPTTIATPSSSLPTSFGFTRPPPAPPAAVPPRAPPRPGPPLPPAPPLRAVLVTLCEGVGLADPAERRLCIVAGAQQHHVALQPHTGQYAWNEVASFTGPPVDIVFEVQALAGGQPAPLPSAVGVVLVDAALAGALAAGEVERWVPLYDDRDAPAGQLRVQLSGRFADSPASSDSRGERPAAAEASTQTAHPHQPPSSETAIGCDVFAPVKALGPFYARLFEELVGSLEVEASNAKAFAHLLVYKNRCELEVAAWKANLLTVFQSQQIVLPAARAEGLLFRRPLAAAVERFARQFHARPQYSKGRNLVTGYDLRAVISGPKGSGKSTLLHLLVAETLLSPALPGHAWAGCLVLPVHWRRFLRQGADLPQFSSQWTRHVVDCLVLQRPALRVYAAAMSAFWQRIISQKHPPLLPSDFQAEHEQAATLWRIRAQRLQSAFHATHFGDFLRGLMELPALMKEAFGFDRLLFVFDDWELTAVQFAPHWADGTEITETVRPYVIEQLRDHMLLVTTCDTLAAKSPSYTIRDVFDDLIPNVLRLSTRGLISNDVVEAEFPRLPRLSFADQRPVSLSAFGGCPGYLARLVRVLLSIDPGDCLEGSGSSLGHQLDQAKRRQLMEFYGRAVECLIQKTIELDTDQQLADLSDWATQLLAAHR